MGIIYRVWLGGPGAIMGVSVIASSAVVGIAYHYIRQRRPHMATPLHLIGFGIIVHICMLALTMTLPSGMKYEVLSNIAIPVILIYPLGTLLVCVVLLDLESRIGAEDALRESDVRYRELVENASEAIFVAQNGQLVFHNPRTAEVLGYPGEELTGRSFVEFIHPDDRDMVLDRHLRRMKGEELPHIYSFRIIRGDGNDRWVELNTVVVNWKGKPATLNFLSDVTDRKRSEEELRESEERFRTLIDKTPLGMSLIDMDGRYEYVNPAFVKIFGYDLSDIPTGKEWFRTAYPDPEYRREVMADRKEDLSAYPKLEIRPRIYEVMCNGGAFRTIMFRPVTLPSGKQFIIYEDITDRKQAEEELRRNQDVAERLAQEIAIIAEIGKVVGSTLDTEEIYERFAAEVRKLIPFDRLSVNLHDLDRGILRPVYVSGEYIAGRQPGEAFPLKGSVSEVLVRTRSGMFSHPFSVEEMDRRFPDHTATCSAFR